jgi:hypothetical protein
MVLKNFTTCTVGLTFQPLIARAFDDDQYLGMASLDQITAFDAVNVKLLPIID